MRRVLEEVRETEGLFTLARSLNQIIRWVNEHEIQSVETLAFRGETEKRLKTLETDLCRVTDQVHARITAVEDRQYRIEESIRELGGREQCGGC